jgi:hypothetical protein
MSAFLMQVQGMVKGVFSVFAIRGGIAKLSG